MNRSLSIAFVVAALTGLSAPANAASNTIKGVIEFDGATEDPNARFKTPREACRAYVKSAFPGATFKSVAEEADDSFRCFWEENGQPNDMSKVTRKLRCPPGSRPPQGSVAGGLCDCDSDLVAATDGSKCGPQESPAEERPAESQPQSEAKGNEDPLARAAAQAGMDPDHVRRLSGRTARTRELIIVRASNPASLRYHADPAVIAKPVSEKRKTAKVGPYAGLVVDEAQKPVLIEGKRVHGDYDLQGLYKQVDGKLLPVYTNFDMIATDLNKEVTPNKPMFQHGANDCYFDVDKATKSRKMKRIPDADENFLIAEPNGSVRVVETLAGLKAYYLKKGLQWLYPDGAGKGGKN